jgi:hypothetical protein
VFFHFEPSGLKLGDSPANLLINQGFHGHTTRAPPGYHPRIIKNPIDLVFKGGESNDQCFMIALEDFKLDLAA